uniref:RRM domain-containing protein n=1 Tax=Rhabditophanes sp. KR3021 TaxID=114890 RepID=A0AC35TMZ9_9BILA
MAPKLIKKKTVKVVPVIASTTEIKKAAPAKIAAPVKADIKLSEIAPTDVVEITDANKITPRRFPNFPKVDGQVDPESDSSVIKLSNLPYGFFEKEMNGFFSQFGKVIRVRVPRSKKTTNFKGYGYVQFEIPEVAEIVAETMDNHIMFDQIMKCTQLKNKDIPEKFFVSKRKILKTGIKKTTTVYLDTMKRCAEVSEELAKTIKTRITTKMSDKKKLLTKLGVKYDMPKVRN